MKLNVLICTYNDGIQKVKNVVLPYRPDVSYIISHQYDEDRYLQTPMELQRRDVAVYKLYGKGLSKNRNFAITHTDGDVAIISDDDVVYKDEYFDQIKKCYQENPELDVGLFKIKTGQNEPEYKSYPSKPFRLNGKDHHFISSIEMTFKIERIKNLIWFDERFGLGSEFLIGGEEKVFISDCQKSGLDIQFFPKYIVEHPYESSNKYLKQFDNRKVRTEGAIDMRINGIISIIRSFYITIRLAMKMLKTGKNPGMFFIQRIMGVSVVLFTNSRTKG